MRIIAQTDNFGVNVKIKPVLDAKDFSNDLKTKIQELSKLDAIETKIQINIAPEINAADLRKKINDAIKNEIKSINIPVNTTSPSLKESTKNITREATSQFEELASLLSKLNYKKSQYTKMYADIQPNEVKKSRKIFDTKDIRDEIRKLNSEYSTLYKTYEKSLSAQEKDFLLNLEYRSTSKNENLQKALNNFYTEQFNAKKKAINSYSNLSKQFDYKDPQKKSNQFIEARKELEKLEQLNNNFANDKKAFASNEQLGEDWTAYSAQLKVTTQAYKEASQAQREYVKQQNVIAGFEKRKSTLLNKSELYLTQNVSGLKSKASDVYKELLLLQNKIKTLDPAVEGSGAVLTQYGRDFQQLQYRAKLAGAEVQTSFERFKDTFKTRARSIASATAFSAVMGAVYSLKQNVVDIDSALTQLKIVTGESNSAIASYFDNAAKNAEKYGNTIKDIVGSTETYSRLGFSLNDSLNLANVTNQFANVAAISEDDATTTMTSIIKAYGKEASDAETIADKLVEVGQKYAVSASELGVALENGGSALAVANTDLDESVALIAAGNASVQDASKVGNAVKTLSAYIRGSEADLKDLGEEIDGTVTSTSKLQDKVKALTGGKVSLLEDDGQTYRSIYDIMVDIADVWDSMSDINRASLIEAIAGKRQANVVSSIITNIKDLKGAYEASTNAAGTLSTATGKYLDSIEGKSAQLSAQWQELSYDLLNTEAIKNFISAGTELLKFLDNLVGKFGSLASVGIGVGLLKGVGAGKDALDRTKRSKTLLGEVFNDLNSTYSKDVIFNESGLLNSVNKKTLINGRFATTEINSLKEITASVEGLTKAEARSALAKQGFSKAVQDQVIANMEHARSLKTVWASMSTFSKVGLIVGAITAVGTAIYKIVEAEIATDKLVEKYNKLKDNVSSSKNELDSLKSKLENIEESILKINNAGSLSLTNQEKLTNLESQKKLLEQTIELKEKEIELEKDKAAAEANKVYESLGEYKVSNGYTLQRNEDKPTANDTPATVAHIGTRWLLGMSTDRHTANDYVSQVQDLLNDGELNKENYDLVEIKENLLEIANNYDTVANSNSKYSKQAQTNLSNILSLMGEIDGVINTTNSSNSSAPKSIVTSILSHRNNALYDVYNKEMKQAADEYNKLSNNPNFDYNNRPVITAKQMKKAGWKDFDGDFATTYTQGYSVGQYFIDITPILDNGKVLSPEELDKYVDSLIGNRDRYELLRSDDKHLITNYQIGDYDKEYWDNYEKSLLIPKDKHLEAFENKSKLGTKEEWEEYINSLSSADLQIAVGFSINSGGSTYTLDELKDELANITDSDRKKYKDLAIETYGDVFANDKESRLNNYINSHQESKQKYKDIADAVRDYELKSKGSTYNNKTGLYESNSIIGTSGFNYVKNLILSSEGGKRFLEILAKIQGTGVDEALSIFIQRMDDTDSSFSDLKAKTQGAANAMSTLANKTATFKDSFEKTATSSESVETLNKAYGNFKSNGNFDFDDLKEIQSNFSDVKGINKYIKQLSKAKKGTTEYKKILSDLTYQKIRTTMSDEEILKSGKDVLSNMLKTKGVTNASAVADSLLARAKANVAAKNFKIGASSNITKKALQTEAEAAGLTKAQFAYLVASQQVFNDNSLSVDDKISALKNLALAAGVTGAAISSIGEGVKNGITNPDGSISYVKNGVLYRGSIDGILNMQLSNTLETSQAEIEKQFAGLDANVNYNGDSGSGSGSGSGSKTDSKLEKFQNWISKLFDWIEVRIGRLQRKVELYQNRAERKMNNSNYGKNGGTASKSSGAYKQYYKAQDAVANEIEATQSGAAKYLSFSNKVLSKAKFSGLINNKQLKEIKSKVRNGTIDISSYSERMQEVIKDYQTYYEKYLDMVDSLEDLNSTLESIAEALYNLPKEQLDKAQEKIDRKNNILSSKGSVAIGASNKNAVLSQSNIQAKIEAQAYKNYASQASKNLVLARAKIDSKSDSALKGLTNKQKNQIISAQRNGLEIDISKFSKLSKAGKAAIIAYNAALRANAVAAGEAEQAQYDYIKTVRENMKEMFDNIKNEWDSVVGDKTFGLGLSDSSLSILQAKGRLLSGALYEGQISLNNQKLSDLQSEKSALLSRLNSIDVGSDEWIEANQSIQDVESEIWSTEAAIAQLEKTIRELDLTNFETLETRISNVANEAAFLVDVMSEEKLFDDDGKITKYGQATAGLYAEKYSIYMKQAEDYGKKVTEWNQKIANDPANADLISERDDLLTKQQEAIKNAQSEKEAIKSLVEQGIKAELDALKELIDKYTDALDSQKELYEYQKKIAEQSSKIARIQKQIAAYAGDDSAEAKTKIQKLQLDLKNAQDDLEESQYDKSISDQKEMLNDLYDDYEELLNKRLDNIDGLLSDVIKYVNSNASNIAETISQEANNVGYTISRENDDIWKGYSVGDIISETGNNFSSVRQTLNGMESHLSSQIAASQQEETNYLGSIYNVLNELKTIITNGNKQEEKSPITEDNGYVEGHYTQVNAGTAMYVRDSNRNWKTSEKDIYRPSDTWTHWIYRGQAYMKGPDGVMQNMILLEDSNGNKRYVRENDLPKNYTWVDNYATGSPSISSNQLAWTQEKGQEAIVRNDGAILTPLAKGNMVLPAKATKNLWNFMNNYDDFNPMKTLGIVKKDISATSFGDLNLNIELPNVQSYDDFVRELQNDRSFEKIVQSITANQLVGSSKYNKYKY